jgi:nickel transport protein
MSIRYYLGALALLVGASPIYAHRLHVDPDIEGNQLRVEVYYDDDTPAQDAKVTVRAGDEVVAEGRTDEKGVWTCPKPGPGTYEVRAESVGHVAKETLVIPDPATDQGPSPTPTAPDETREAATRTPWRRLGLGIGLIAGVALMTLVLRKSSTPRPKGE